MSRQIGSLHRSISHPANLQNNFPIIHFLLSRHLNHLILTPHRAWNQILIPTLQYITPSPNSTTPISKHATNLQTLNPAHLQFLILPFNLYIPKSKLNLLPFTLPFYRSHPNIAFSPANHPTTSTKITHTT